MAVVVCTAYQNLFMSCQVILALRASEVSFEDQNFTGVSVSLLWQKYRLLGPSTSAELKTEGRVGNRACQKTPPGQTNPRNILRWSCTKAKHGERSASGRSYWWHDRTTGLGLTIILQHNNVTNDTALLTALCCFPLQLRPSLCDTSRFYH